MKTCQFLGPAEEELNEAARFYDERSAGLGGDFLEEVEKTVWSIAAHPSSGVRVSGNIRRRLLRRFPYGVLYAREPDSIVIVAIMHLNREPGYWKKRL